MLIKTKDNQTILDIAMQYYGNAEAVGEILTNNSSLSNDAATVVSNGRKLGSFYFDLKLTSGQLINIDSDSALIKKNVIKKIKNDVTTYIQ